MVLAIRSLNCSRVVSESSNFRRLNAGEARGAILGLVACDLNLPAEREHVGSQPPPEQNRVHDARAH
jgi:hypothetical protein